MAHDEPAGAPIPKLEEAAETDTGLWRRGDEPAFGELFERHVEAVWKYCYRLTASRTLAEDMSAETFCIAWRRRGKVTLVKDSALPWLYTVAANLIRTERRKSGRLLRAVRKMPLEVVPDHAEHLTHQHGVEHQLRQVLAAIRLLPKAEHRAVELCLLGDLSTADAAELLGVAESTVRVYVSRARAKLRTTLEESS
jgi:RNA polymerase sigma factor (sigma-70 family)